MPTTSEFVDSTPLLGNAEALRQRMADEGFLYFRKFIPRLRVMALREQMLLIFQKYGWLAEGTDLLDGIAAPASADIDSWSGVGAPHEAYADVYRLEAFHRLSHDPAIMRLMEALFGEPVLPHPRNIARLMFPSKANSPTPPHQDHIFIQGTKTVYTYWMPLGDCPKSLGGLSVMRRSTGLGLLPVRQALGAGGRTVILDGVEQEWVEGDFEAGDALVFHSLTVHKSMPNQAENRIRLSCDYRYQPLSLPIEEKSLRTHCDVLNWDEVYAGWPASASDLRYFWRGYRLDMQTFDDSLLAIQPA